MRIIVLGFMDEIFCSIWAVGFDLKRVSDSSLCYKMLAFVLSACCFLIVLLIDDKTEKKK
jgi:hypothetical protein